MEDKYLVVNAGSSSLKFSLYNENKEEIVNGNIEKIGREDSFYTLKFNNQKVQKNKVIMNHEEAVSTMLDELISNRFILDIVEIKGIGHRVLHGGEYYSDSIVIDEEVLNNIKELTKFGPLHHPGEIAGIEIMQKALPNVPNIAVFDTAFHQTMKPTEFLYALPMEYYEKYGVRKYGFHGTSHKYITEYLKDKLNKEDINIINCHIGNGASIACIKDGVSFDTTMGLTPLDGLIMGTRCGSIDPSIVEYLCIELKKTVSEVNLILNKKSGLYGIAGDNDFRGLKEKAQEGNELAQLAIKMFQNSIVRNIADYYLKLNGKVDALVFTAGIAENNVEFRESILSALSPLGVTVNQEENKQIAKFLNKTEGMISGSDSKIPVYVIPTNEEIMILKDTIRLSKEKGMSLCRK